MHRLNHKLTQCGRLIKYKMYDVPRSPLTSCSRSWEGEIMGTSSSFLRNNVEEIGKSSVFNKIMKKNTAINSIADNKLISKDILRIHDAPLLFERRFSSSIQAYSLNKCHAWRFIPPVRSFASDTSQKMSEKEKRKDVSTIEDPFDAPTYNIPEKPVTFTEGASYSIVILAGLGVAAAAAYAVFKELIFEPKEYKIFGKALERVQNDSQVRVRIGTPVTGYGQESRNRAARQRIPYRMWTDEDGVERVEVNFYIRGPHGGGKVYTEMFRDKLDKTWKFTYLIVDIKSPSPTQLMLESYVPA